MTNKIAEITIFFWILKIIATTLGETAGDMLSMTLQLGYIESFWITSGILFVLLFSQIRLSHFHSLLFWATIVGTTTVGTEISDMMDRTFHFGYLWGSVILTSCLVITLAFWFIREKNLQVYPILAKWKEITFWVAVIFSNSLGTAFGDFLTDNLGLSYITGAMVTSGIIAIVLLLHYTTKVNEDALFWIAFIFTRPFGATFGDFLTKSHDLGGLALGRIESSLVLLALFSIILYLSHKRHHVD